MTTQSDTDLGAIQIIINIIKMKMIITIIIIWIWQDSMQFGWQ